MSTLTKEQFEQLSPEQQNLMATLEVQRLKQHGELMRRACGNRRQLVWVLVAELTIFLGLAAVLGIATHSIEMTWPFLFFGLLVWSSTGMWYANDRMDALVELWAAENKAMK